MSYNISVYNYENIIKHLVDLEDQREKLVEDFFPEPTRERNEFIEFLDDYIHQLELFLKECQHDSTPSYDQLPFVIVGCEVDVYDLEYDEIFSFRIVPPFQYNVESQDVSCFSPVGRALLLKKIGDIIEVKAPGGLFTYRIETIRLSDER
ncbi:MAG: GreA/GreB family elongation factor [Syntrophomonadaceae bacterium]|nr:GreA/GreB family elongation factor [Syntrophomonadaceae bacterium]